MPPLAAHDPDQVGPYVLRGRLGGGSQDGDGRGARTVHLGESPPGVLVTVTVLDAATVVADPSVGGRLETWIDTQDLDGGPASAVSDSDVDTPAPWYARALVREPSLEELVSRSGPLPAERVAALGQALAGELSETHACGFFAPNLTPIGVAVAVPDLVLLDEVPAALRPRWLAA